jgi:hypothetical protein
MREFLTHKRLAPALQLAEKIGLSRPLAGLRRTLGKL